MNKFNNVTILPILKEALNTQLISLSDFFFATIIFKNQHPKIILSAVCVSYYTNLGNTCLPLSIIKNRKVFTTNNYNLINRLWNIAEQTGKNWIQEFKKSNAISNGKTNNITPLIFSNNNQLYTYKLWKAEQMILKFILEKPQYKLKKLNKVLEILNQEENKNLDDLQKVAILLSIINRITFIIGGPGTGKTTIISKILIIFIHIFNKKLNIKLTAPTGKATQRLINSIKNFINSSNLKLIDLNFITKNTITLHSLLKLSPYNTPKNTKIKSHLINLDLLIIDESSMIDTLIMEKLVCCVPKTTKIIFIGDCNQLPSIKCGQILKDICSYYKDGFSKNVIEILKKITNLKINIINNSSISKVNDKIIMLKKNYRVNINSDIYKLSQQIKKNQTNYMKKLFNNNYKNIKFVSLNSNILFKNYDLIISNIVKNYTNYWKLIKQKKKLSEIMSQFNKNRLLCALKKGIFGTKILNNEIENKMKKKNWIKKITKINTIIWYIGRPIIILKNNKILNLFNGDVGITLLDKNKKLAVFFETSNKKNISIPVNLVPEHQTNWAMTIHKSQGSEFKHVIITLPNVKSEMINKELIYTAITRSYEKITLFSNKNILIKSINSETKRNTGITFKN